MSNIKSYHIHINPFIYHVIEFLFVNLSIRVKDKPSSINDIYFEASIIHLTVHKFRIRLEIYKLPMASFSLMIDKWISRRITLNFSILLQT